MITFLEGKLTSALPTQATIDVHGVGYEVFIPLSSYDKLPPVGQPLRILTHLHVREDVQVLYGFMTVPERDLFRLLVNNVSGIGPKLALAVLSGMTVLLAETRANSPNDHNQGGEIGKFAKRAGLAHGLPVLWRQPQDVDGRDLFYGPGGEGHQPGGRFTFVDEDLDGSNPKFNVRDDAGMKWKIKLGAEARPETVASRLVWAVGYSADEDYFLREVVVRGMPLHLHRGQHLVGANGTMRDVRLKREPDDRKKLGNWQWHNNPFTGTRELNGLRVLMAVINNYDLKDVNNAIRGNGRDGTASADDLVYEVGDLGSKAVQDLSELILNRFLLYMKLLSDFTGREAF